MKNTSTEQFLKRTVIRRTAAEVLTFCSVSLPLITALKIRLMMAMKIVKVSCTTITIPPTANVATVSITCVSWPKIKFLSKFLPTISWSYENDLLSSWLVCCFWLLFLFYERKGSVYLPWCGQQKWIITGKSVLLLELHGVTVSCYYKRFYDW